jgi:hypothetical protein
MGECVFRTRRTAAVVTGYHQVRYDLSSVSTSSNEVQVQALDAKGRVLGTSAVRRITGYSTGR